MKVIRLDNLEGLIAFPSFHTAAAVLYAWAVWPIRSIRWPLAALNLAIISTTPVCGAHYAIDVVAGAAVALGSIVASSLLRRNKAGMGRAPLEWQSSYASIPGTIPDSRRSTST
jgi:membrane-associated phospholipid phosphatase